MPAQSLSPAQAGTVIPAKAGIQFVTLAARQGPSGMTECEAGIVIPVETGIQRSACPRAEGGRHGHDGPVLDARQGHSGMTARRGLPDKGIRA